MIRAWLQGSGSSKWDGHGVLPISCPPAWWLALCRKSLLLSNQRLVIQGEWLQKMEDIAPEANARDHSLMVLARHCVKAPWQENLGSKNVTRSDFSSHWRLQMVSSRPITVLCNSLSTHAV